MEPRSPGTTRATARMLQIGRRGTLATQGQNITARRPENRPHEKERTAGRGMRGVPPTRRKNIRVTRDEASPFRGRKKSNKSSGQSQNVKRGGRRRNLTRKARLRRKRSSPN